MLCRCFPSKFDREGCEQSIWTAAISGNIQYSRCSHYNDVIMSATASQITSLTIVYSTVYSRRRSKWVRTCSKLFSCTSVLTVCSYRAQSNSICTYEGCHVGFFREFVGTACCTYGQLNTTILTLKTNSCLDAKFKSVYPDSKVHVANMGPTWVLSAPGGLHVGPINLVIRVVIRQPPVPTPCPLWPCIPDSKVHGANMGHLGPVGPRWAPRWPHEPCYQGCYPSFSCSRRLWHPGHIGLSFLHVIQVFISYLLMLVFMTFNVYLCVAVLAGAFVGYFLFHCNYSGKSMAYEINEHCNWGGRGFYNLSPRGQNGDKLKAIINFAMQFLQWELVSFDNVLIEYSSVGYMIDDNSSLI